MSARRPALAALVLALVGLGAALYLSAVKVAGGLPVCGPVKGCDTVALSSYSELFGVPVAFLGVGSSVVLVALCLAWWRTDDRRARLALYGLGLFGILFAGYLTYLELFVIHAVCIWCVTYALTIVLGWLLAAGSLRGGSTDDPPDD